MTAAEEFDFTSVGAADPMAAFLEFPAVEETEDFDNPDDGIITRPVQSRTAKQYSAKMRKLMQTAFRVTAAKEQTVADSAALIMHSENISEKFGNLAEADARVARGIDWLVDGSENPYAAAITATVPLILQMIRNHEPQLEPAQRGIRVPFTKGKRVIKLRFGIKLGQLEPLTNDPDALVQYVYSQPAVIDKIKKHGIYVAFRESRKQRRAAADS